MAMRIALIRWEKTVARLEKVVSYSGGNQVNKPYDIDEVAKVFTDAVTDLRDSLEKLDYIYSEEDPMLSGVQKAAVWTGIKNIRKRIASVVLYEGAPVTNSDKQINKDLAGLSSLRTVGEIESIPLESDLFFKGFEELSKSSLYFKILSLAINRASGSFISADRSLIYFKIRSLNKHEAYSRNHWYCHGFHWFSSCC